MDITMNTMLSGWVNECGRGAPFPTLDHRAFWIMAPNEYAIRRRVESGEFPDEAASLRQWWIDNPKLVVRVDETGALVVKRASDRYTVWTELARHVGKRDHEKSFVLLNGDGFEMVPLQRLQAQVRTSVQTVWQYAKKRMVVPYQALLAAGLELDSIVPIHISPDQNVTQTVHVVKPSESVLAKLPPTDSEPREVSYRGYRYWYRLPYYGAKRPPQWRIMHRAEFAAAEQWHEIVNPLADEWEVQERQHRLGQAVFRARDRNGEVHRWISGFDQNENPAMYFLAQLPDRGGIRYVTHAVRALAPRIVHQARADGRRVFRQGDIFAVETDLTDDDFAKHRVVDRREVFLDDNRLLAFGLTRQGRAIRRQLMIYGTGHTADQVCVTSRGTFVKGRMYHDPILENVRVHREREHQTVVLDENVWFLCVRNTVPRLSTSSDTN